MEKEYLEIENDKEMVDEIMTGVVKFKNWEFDVYNLVAVEKKPTSKDMECLDVTISCEDATVILHWISNTYDVIPHIVGLEGFSKLCSLMSKALYLSKEEQ